MAAENGSAQSQSICPLPNLHLNVKVSDEEVAFQEVSGLDMESEPLEYVQVTLSSSARSRYLG